MSRSAQNDGYAAQTNLTPDPTLTLILTLTPTQPNALGGSRSALKVGRGCTDLTCNSENLVRTCNFNLTPGAEIVTQNKRSAK